MPSFGDSSSISPTPLQAEPLHLFEAWRLRQTADLLSFGVKDKCFRPMTPVFERALAAVKRSDIKTLGDLGQQHEGLLEMEPPEGSLLHHASRRGKVKVVEFLLDHGIPPNPVDSEGQTPLFMATSIAGPCNRTAAMIKMLLCAGADVNWQDFHGRVPLSYAVVRGAVDAVKRRRVELLLSLGADPRIRDFDGCAPVDYVGMCTDGGAWYKAVPDDAKELKLCRELLKKEMHRRDVKLLLLVARRRLWSPEVHKADAKKKAPIRAAPFESTSSGRARAVGERSVRPRACSSVHAEDRDNAGKGSRVMDVTERLVAVEDHSMFRLCITFI